MRFLLLLAWVSLLQPSPCRLNLLALLEHHLQLRLGRAEALPVAEDARPTRISYRATRLCC